jgi:hypothetical protein
VPHLGSFWRALPYSVRSMCPLRTSKPTEIAYHLQQHTK